MRGAVIAGVGVAFAAAVAVLVALAPTQPPPRNPIPPPAPPVELPLEPTPDPGPPGAVRGGVRYLGDPPPPLRVPIAGDAFCTAAWPDGGPPDPRFVVNEGGALPNVIVWAWKGPHTERTWPTPKEPVRMHMERCMFEPHVLGVRVGQPFTMENRDRTAMCFRLKPKRNPEVNRGLPAGETCTVVFEKRERQVPVYCDCHPWMSAWTFLFDHPFFAVTDETGSFAIEGLPPGTYEFRAWHETFGQKLKQTVTVPAGGTAEIAFDIPAH